MRKTLKITGLLLIMMFSADYYDDARAEAYVNFDLFYQSLDPYGGWINHADFGYVWSPAGVGPDWQPYVDGRWEYSDSGWIWVSYEPWGWATYHYGRWILDPYYGWIWIPGVDWAPAYVSWYDSPGYVGWAPLPPDNSFFISIGLFFGGGYFYGDYYRPYYGGHHHHHNNYYSPDNCVVFVPEKHFHHKNLKVVRVGHGDHSVVYRGVRNVDKAGVRNQQFTKYGPDRGYMEKATHSKYNKLSIEDARSAVHKGSRNTVRNGKYEAYKPDFDYRSNSGKPFNKSLAGTRNDKNRAKNNYAVTERNREPDTSQKNNYDNRQDQRIKNSIAPRKTENKTSYFTNQKPDNKNTNRVKKSEYPYPESSSTRNQVKRQYPNYNPDYNKTNRSDYKNGAVRNQAPSNQKNVFNGQNRSYDNSYSRNYNKGNPAYNRSYKNPAPVSRQQNTQKSYTGNKNPYNNQNQGKSVNRYNNGNNQSYGPGDRGSGQNSYSRGSNNNSYNQGSYNNGSYNRGSFNKSGNMRSFGNSKSFSKR